MAILFPAFAKYANKLLHPRAIFQAVRVHFLTKIQKNYSIFQKPRDREAVMGTTL